MCLISSIRNRLFSSRSFSSPEETVGQKCTVIEEIDNFRGCGMVKVGNQMWAARAAFDEDIFKAGENLSIVAIEGVKLICKKI